MYLNYLQSANRESFKQELLDADVVVYDLMQNPDEAVWAAEIKSII